MLSIKWFESMSDLERLTGLDRDGLRGAGFELDDWDFGIRVNRRLHRIPSEAEIRDEPYLAHEICPDWDSEGHWLLSRMCDYCVGASYVKLGRWHYYLCHHA